jgi:mycoredoxin
MLTRLGVAEDFMSNGMELNTARNELDAPVLMYSTAWCVDCWRAKQVMDSMQVEYTEVDITQDEEAAELVMRLNRGYRSVPTLVFPDGSIMTEPRTTALVEKLQSLL